MANRQVPLICSGHSRPVVDIAYSPITADGFFLISGCLDGKPMLRNGETGDWIGTFEGHKGAVWSVSMNSTATSALTGSADFTAKVWDAISGEATFTFLHPHIVKSVDFSVDCKRILTGCQDKKLRIFSLGKQEVELILEGHTQPVKVALFSKNDENIIISGGQDKILKVWDIRTQKETLNKDIGAAITSMELSRKGTVLTTTSGNVVTFWDAKTLDKIKSYTLAVETHSASLHPEHPRFVAGGQDFWVRVYDYENGETLETHKGHHGAVHCIRFAPDGETYASGSEDGTIRLYQTTIKQYGLWQAPVVLEFSEDDETTEKNEVES